jgi:hypothetical protein
MIRTVRCTRASALAAGALQAEVVGVVAHTHQDPCLNPGLARYVSVCVLLCVGGGGGGGDRMGKSVYTNRLTRDVSARCKTQLCTKLYYVWWRCGFGVYVVVVCHVLRRIREVGCLAGLEVAASSPRFSCSRLACSPTTSSGRQLCPAGMAAHLACTTALPTSQRNSYLPQQQQQQQPATSAWGLGMRQRPSCLGCRAQMLPLWAACGSRCSHRWRRRA